MIQESFKGAVTPAAAAMRVASGPLSVPLLAALFGIVFLPAALIAYNETALPYALVYVVFGLAGEGIGLIGLDEGGELLIREIAAQDAPVEVVAMATTDEALPPAPSERV